LTETHKLNKVVATDHTFPTTEGLAMKAFGVNQIEGSYGR